MPNCSAFASDKEDLLLTKTYCISIALTLSHESMDCKPIFITQNISLQERQITASFLIS